MFNVVNETPLVALYRTEYHNDYQRMIKNGIYPCDDSIRVILGYPVVRRKKFLGIF
jgi:hypothetical protein